MKQVLYYLTLVAIFIALDLVICFVFAFANLKAGGILFNSLLVGALMITGSLSPYIKKWLKIKEKKEEKKEEGNS